MTSKSCLGRNRGWTALLLAALAAQVLLAVAVIVLAHHGGGGLSSPGAGGGCMSCLLMPRGDWPAACILADAVGCVSLLVALVVVALHAFAGGACGCRAVDAATRRAVAHANTALLGLSGLLWLGAAAVLLFLAVRADSAGVPGGQRRWAVVVCCWLSAALLVLLLADQAARSRRACAEARAQALAPGPAPARPQLGVPLRFHSGVYPGAPPAAALFTPPLGVPAAAGQLPPHAAPPGLVVGVPVAPGAPVAPPPMLRTASGRPLAPAELQMALLSGGGLVRIGSQRSAAPPPPALAAGGGPARPPVASEFGRVLVVNRLPSGYASAPLPSASVSAPPAFDAAGAAPAQPPGLVGGRSVA